MNCARLSLGAPVPLVVVCCVRCNILDSNRGYRFSDDTSCFRKLAGLPSDASQAVKIGQGKGISGAVSGPSSASGPRRRMGWILAGRPLLRASDETVPRQDSPNSEQACRRMARSTLSRR